MKAKVELTKNSPLTFELSKDCYFEFELSKFEYNYMIAEIGKKLEQSIGDEIREKVEEIIKEKVEKEMDALLISINNMVNEEIRIQFKKRKLN